MATQKPKNIFDQIAQTRGEQDKSMRWYQDKMRDMSASVTPNKLLRIQNQLTNRIQVGSMYMYIYDPKLKETLPYYDTFPLVFPYKKVPGGFYGINLHYLPYGLRFQLLQRLFDLATDTTITDSTRLVMSWKVLSASSKFAAVTPCVKHYLDAHVMSRFLQIPPKDWATAVMLPVERFVGATKNKVWRDSRGMI